MSCPRVCPQGGLFIPPSHYPKLLRSHPCLVLGAAIGDRHALELLGARFVTDTGTPTDTGSGSLCRPIPSAAVRPLMVRQLPPLTPRKFNSYGVEILTRFDILPWSIMAF